MITDVVSASSVDRNSAKYGQIPGHRVCIFYKDVMDLYVI